MSKQRYTSWKKLTEDDRTELCMTVRWQDLLNRLGIPFKVRNNGRIYALSPFKRESTPSMLCSEEGRYYGHFHCFASGECGDKVWLVSKLLDRPMCDPVVLRHFNYEATSITQEPNQGRFNFDSKIDFDPHYPF